MKHPLFLLIAVLLGACCSPLTAAPTPEAIAPTRALWSPSPPTASSTSPATSTRTPSPLPSSTASLAITISPTPLPDPRAHIRRVFILSIDGWRPETIFQAPMNNVITLMQVGAYSLAAQTILPSATLPAHASMLTGMCPAKHGVIWNDYLPLLGYAQGTDLFDLAHEAGLQTVMYVGKEKLRQVTEPASLDTFEFVNDRDLVIADQLIQNFPADFGVLFVHFPTADWMGHEYGWLSEEQLSVLRRADEALGKLLAQLELLGIGDETLILLTADHGGHGQLHGTSLPEDMTIPWIVAGPGVEAAHLTTPIYTMDTAATAAWALGLSIPPEWDGRPVLEAFGLAADARPEAVCP